MKLLHTADWHIGRTLNGFRLYEEQVHAYEQIVALAKKEQVDGIVIAGDLYDRSIPPLEAVELLNQMIERLVCEEQFPVYAISGNHDSAKRLSFGQTFYSMADFHLGTSLKQSISPIETQEAQVYLLPFVDPSEIRIFCQQELAETPDVVQTYKTITQGITRLISEMKKTMDPSKKQILITHFAVTKTVEDQTLTNLRISETTSTVGGLATLPSHLFADFDYVALGHIHTHLASPEENIVYSGSPIHFHSQEAQREKQKGVYLVTLDEQGVTKTFHPLTVKKPIVTLAASFETLCDPLFYQNQPVQAAWFSLHLVGYDRRALAGVNIRARLEEIYGKGIVDLTFEELERNNQEKTVSTVEKMAPEETIATFYETIAKRPPSDYQKQLIETLLINTAKEN